MYKKVSITELAKDTRNTVEIEMPDGTKFEISYLSMVTTEKYQCLIDESTEQIKLLAKTEAIGKLAEKETSIEKQKEYLKQLEQIYASKKGGADKYYVRMLGIVKAILIKNGYEFSKKYWKDLDSTDIMNFIRAAIEKDIDPLKKKVV